MHFDWSIAYKPVNSILYWDDNFKANLKPKWRTVPVPFYFFYAYFEYWIRLKETFYLLQFKRVRRLRWGIVNGNMSYISVPIKQFAWYVHEDIAYVHIKKYKCILLSSICIPMTTTTRNFVSWQINTIAYGSFTFFCSKWKLTGFVLGQPCNTETLSAQARKHGAVPD